MEAPPTESLYGSVVKRRVKGMLNREVSKLARLVYDAARNKETGLHRRGWECNGD